MPQFNPKNTIWLNKPKKRTEPLWRGPESDHEQGGITFSLLSRWLVCRERFRVHAVEGVGPANGFSHRLEYGSMWHIAEEFHAQGCAWEGPLLDYAKDLCRKYPLAQDQINHWYEVCNVQFPHYVRYWENHPEMVNRRPVQSEVKFRVSYRLPSGRTVYLRGKWDSVDLVTSRDPKTKKVRNEIWLQENKTKGEIDETQLKRQLTFDLQTMLYLVALWEKPSCDLPRTGHYRHSDGKEYPIAGVRYNVVRRPLSGGKHSIRQHQATKNKPGETSEQFYSRLSSLIAGEPEFFFMRWNVNVLESHVEAFKKQCLNPILDTLCNWYDHITGSSAKESPFDCRGADRDWMVHWRHPFGVWNILDEGGSSDLDEYLATGSMAGLSQLTDLFPELA